MTEQQKQAFIALESARTEVAGILSKLNCKSHKYFDAQNALEAFYKDMFYDIFTGRLFEEKKPL